MKMTRSSSRIVHLCATAAVASSLLAALPARADADHEAALESRVTELEKLVKQLLAERQAAPAATVAPAPSVAAAGKGPAPVQQVSITPNAATGTTFLFTGYAKADVLYTDAGNGVIAEGTPGRDFYLPSATPVGKSSASKDPNLNAHVKQTRLTFGTDTPLEGKDKVSTRFEFDLYGTSLGDQRATNTYGVQLRHAYVQWRNWLVGQTWSNFMDATALPETADYIGTTDGTVFVRQPQLRYTYGGLSVSLENRQATLIPYQGVTAEAPRIVSDDGVLPDLTARYTWSTPWGYLSVAGLVRQLKYHQVGKIVNDEIVTGAGNVSGKVNIGKDDVRFAINGGNLGRYVGVNFANDAVINASGHFKAIDGYAGFVAYRHVWVGTLRSTLSFAAERYDNDVALTGGTANKSSSSWTANLFYSPFTKLDIGAEFRHATREIESGVSGSLNRVEFTGKYSF